MSRARPIAGKWFDVYRNDQKATEEQIELLVTVSDFELEDLLDGSSFDKEYLTQGEVVAKLREALGQVIPDDVLQRRQEWREERKKERDCRRCGKIGDSTKHHFINRWILRQLDGYQHHWADRTRSCIPLCIHCHRDLHSRSNGPHSIAEHLTDEEREFAEEAIHALYDQKPSLFLMIARGSESVYETRLIRDWIEGQFSE